MTITLVGPDATAHYKKVVHWNPPCQCTTYCIIKRRQEWAFKKAKKGQGQTRPNHCVKPAGLHPGYRRKKCMSLLMQLLKQISVMNAYFVVQLTFIK